MTASRVAVVLWSGNPGGAESFGVNLADELARLGCDVLVTTVTHSGPITERLRQGRVGVLEIGLDRGSEVIPCGKRLVKALHSQHVGACILPIGGYLAAAMRLWGYKGVLVSQDHGSLLNLRHLGLRGGFVKRLERFLDPFVLDAQVAVSEYMKLEVERYPHAKRLVVIPNGVRVQEHRYCLPADSAPSVLRVGFAGRLIRGKGLPALLDASTELIRRGVPHELHIAGTGPLLDWLKSRQLEHVSGASIHLHGYVNDVGLFWSGVDVCVVPSDTWTESFGMVAAEAMACGRPVVASAAGGLLEVVDDGVSGFLVPPGDANALAEALAAYAQNRRLLADHGAAAARIAKERFSLKRCAESYLALLRELGFRCAQ